MIARTTLLLALLLSGSSASEDDVNSSSLRGSEERELKRCPRVDFSAPCGRDGRICFDCICLDGGWTCGLTDTQLAEAAAQVPVVSRPSLCERSNFNRPCRRRHEGRVCGDCTCTDREWVCGPEDPTTPAVVTVGGGGGGLVEETTTTAAVETTTEAPPGTPDCRDVPDFGGSCAVDGQQCISDRVNCPRYDETAGACVDSYVEVPCTCFGDAWACAVLDCPVCVPPPTITPDCVDLPSFSGEGQCASGQNCINERINCPVFDSGSNTCVDNIIEATCRCFGGNWGCALPSCLACQDCESATLTDGEYCYIDGMQCPNDSDNSDCWCQEGRWACVPRIVIETVPPPVIETVPPPVIVGGGGGGSGGVNIEASCDSLSDFGGAFFPCTSEGTQCLFATGNCEGWDAASGQCVPGTQWEASCTCGFGSWNCDPIPSCVPCQCTDQYVVDGGYCFGAGQVCRDQSDALDCTCNVGANGAGTWSCPQ